MSDTGDEESADIGGGMVAKDSVIGPIVAAVAFTEDRVTKIEEEEITSAAADGQNEQQQHEASDIDDELLKPYHCGVGPCHPSWLQVFANKKFLTFLLCVFAFVQGSLVSGFTSVVLSTIQTRYQFNSTAAGFIAVSYDITVTISIVFISYFGGKTHRPRYLGVSLIIIGIGSLVFASPQFLYGPYRTDSGSSNTDLELCLDQRNITSECSISNDLAFSTYIIGNILIGIGATPLYTVGVAYIDELVFPKYVPIHFGLFQMVSVLGPAFGYGVGSAFLSVYVDPWVETSLTTSDPSWVGAWWIPFTLMSCCSFLLSIPFLMYPRWLPDSYLVRKERAKEMARIYDQKYANENQLTIVVKMFPVQVKRLLTNIPFVMQAISLSFLFLLVSGFVSFAPKYFQNQYQQTATAAGLLSGGVGITAAGIGTISGGIILYVTKIRGRKLAVFITTVILLMVPITPAFLLNCPSLQVVGITAPYPDGSQSGRDSSSCSVNCSCSSTVLEPVCGSDGYTYFSPCRAGCIQGLIDNTYFSNCSCVAERLESIYSNISHDIILSNYSTASNGRCEQDCSALVPSILILLITFYLVFIIQIPIQYFTVRIVADDQRYVALGLQSAIYRVFGTIPGPLLFGALFDTSCLDWQNECGRRGNCWVYDNHQLSIKVLSFSAPCLFLSALFYSVSIITHPKTQQQPVANGDVIEDSAGNGVGPPSPDVKWEPPRRLSTQMKLAMSSRRRSSNNRKESTCSEDVLFDRNGVLKHDEDIAL